MQLTNAERDALILKVYILWDQKKPVSSDNAVLEDWMLLRWADRKEIVHTYILEDRPGSSYIQSQYDVQV